jgi:hypothetical protein
MAIRRGGITHTEACRDEDALVGGRALWPNSSLTHGAARLRAMQPMSASVGCMRRGEAQSIQYTEEERRRSAG